MIFVFKIVKVKVSVKVRMQRSEIILEKTTKLDLVRSNLESLDHLFSRKCIPISNFSPLLFDYLLKIIVFLQVVTETYTMTYIDESHFWTRDSSSWYGVE